MGDHVCLIFMTPEVMAKGLHNALHTLTGRGLDRFQPSQALEAAGVSSVTNVELERWAQRPFLKSTHDEEATGFKMMNFLAGPCGLRVLPEPEGSHPMWNDFLNCVNYAGLKPVLLKATLLCNWSRGPFSSGTHQGRLVDAAATQLWFSIFWVRSPHNYGRLKSWIQQLLDRDWLFVLILCSK